MPRRRRDSKKKDLLWSVFLALLALLFWLYYPKPPELATGSSWRIPKKESHAVVSHLSQGKVVAEVENLSAVKPTISFDGLIPLQGGTKKLPVEVIRKGKPPEWVYVEVEHAAVPEPEIFSLLALAGAALVFRRKRVGDAGKAA
ncbi:MAG: PEP-CTERM sorting domain-containing protein [Verrucomicrobiota bacterium]